MQSIESSEVNTAITRTPPSAARPHLGGTPSSRLLPGLDGNGLRVASLNLGGRNTNPVEFVLKGDNSELGVEAIAVLRKALKALLRVEEGPRLMPGTEAAVIREILSEIYGEGELQSAWRSRVEGLLSYDTWEHVIAFVQANSPHFFNALNLCTLKLRRPSVWEDPSSCARLYSAVDYLTAWRQWFRGLDRAGTFWLEEAPRVAKKRGMDVATAFAGLLIFDVMSVCTARCVIDTGRTFDLVDDEDEREVPFGALAELASKLPASNLIARQRVAENFIASAHVVLAQEGRTFAGHPAVEERFLPPFCALDGLTQVFLRRDSFAEATDISGAVAENMLQRSPVPEDWQKAWRTSANRLAAVVCQCEPSAGGFRACFVSLHCSKSECTSSFIERLRDVLSEYDADLHVVGMDANCPRKEACAFQRKLRMAGFEIGCQPQVQQVTVAKQRTAFQTQVEKYGEIDISHKDYIVSWGPGHVKRGYTAYTPDLRTAYGVDQETKRCVRLPTTSWPFDHCGVTTSFRTRSRCRERMQWSRQKCSSCAVALLVILVLSMLFAGRERQSPYGQPGSWYYTTRTLTHRSGICEAAPPCRSGWTSFGGSCYMSTARSSHRDVIAACEALGSTLVSIGSEAENQLITGSLCPEAEFCYIGLQGDLTTEEHAWLSGEPVTYSRLIPARTPALPLFPASRRTEQQVAILNNLPGEVSGCHANLAAPFDQGVWPELHLALAGIATVFSGGVVTLSRSPGQRFSTLIVCLLFITNIIWCLPKIWLMCYEDDFHRVISIFGSFGVVNHGAHAAMGVLTLWLSIKRLVMLYPMRAIRSMFAAIVCLWVALSANASLFVDNTAEVRPSSPVLLQSALFFVMTVLSALLTGLISRGLYRAWSFLGGEANAGLSMQGGTKLTTGVRAAKFHFFSVLAAAGSSAVRMAAILWVSIVTTLDSYPVWAHGPLFVFTFLDAVTNSACVHLLAAMDIDASIILAKGITLEVSERASREVEQHRLAVRLLKAAPTSMEQWRELGHLETKARASLGTDHARQEFMILQSAVQVETARIHQLMECVCIRSMTMPVRYQYLIDVPAVEGTPRQHVPAEFMVDESVAGANAYFEWLYAEASRAEETFFTQLKQLLANFNSTPWSSDLGLAREEFPWTIWAAGSERPTSRRLVEADDISPGDILTHRRRGACCGVARGASTCCVVLEEMSASRVRVHRSGMLSPEEVCKEELRTWGTAAVFVPGPKKKKERCLDKISADYEQDGMWPAAASLVDICRCTIVLDDPYAIAVLVAYIRSKMRVVRLKNRFSEDALDMRDPKELQTMFETASMSGQSCCSTSSRYRDISMNVEIVTPNKVPFICEVQVTLSNLAILKHADQKLYTLRRMKSPAELLRAHVFVQD